MENNRIEINVNNIYIYKYFLLTFNDNYVDVAIGLVKSILANTNEKVCFIVFTDKFNDKTLQKLRDANASFIIYYIDEGLFNYDAEIHKSWPIHTMFRLIAPWVIEEKNDYLYYLDCDMICKSNVDDLFNLSFDESIAMCFEISGNINKQCDIFGNDSVYCNAGFLIYNIKRIKEKYKMNEMLDYLNSILDNLKFGDQDFLNLYYVNDTKYLNALKYNAQLQEYITTYGPNCLNNTIFIHFSSVKPWSNRSFMDSYNIYLEYSKYDVMSKNVSKARKQYILLKPFRFAKRVLRKIYRIIFRKK